MNIRFPFTFNHGKRRPEIFWWVNNSPLSKLVNIPPWLLLLPGVGSLAGTTETNPAVQDEGHVQHRREDALCARLTGGYTPSVRTEPPLPPQLNLTKLWSPWEWPGQVASHLPKQSLTLQKHFGNFARYKLLSPLFFLQSETMVGLGPGANQRDRIKLLILGLRPSVSFSGPARNRWHTRRGLTGMNVMKALRTEVWGGVRGSAREERGTWTPGKGGSLHQP